MEYHTPNNATHDPVLTLEEVAEELRVSKAHTAKLAAGKVSGVPPLPAIRLGRRVLVRRSSLERWKIDSEARTSGAILPPSPEVHAVGRMKGKNGNA